MVRCIWCGEEIEGLVKDHLAEKHLGISGESKKIDHQNPDLYSGSTANSTFDSIEGTPNTIGIKTSKPTLPPPITANEIDESPAKTQTSIPPQQPLEPQPRPKRRYFNGNEILSLIQNTNRVYAKEILPCPLTKQEETN